MRRPMISGLTLAAAIAAACGGSSSPTNPSNPTPPGGSSSQSCRNSPTSVTSVATAGSFTATSTTACNFDTATRRGTCAIQFSDSSGGSFSANSVTTFNSVADFVDEVGVVPPLTKSLQSTSTGTNGAGSTVNTFDGQGRLTRTVATTPAGQVTTTTHTAWDSAGRPTNARDVGPGFDNTRIITYDDTARTRTTTVVGLSGLLTVETFDANGNPTRSVATAPGSTQSTTITTNSIQRVCK